MKPKYDSQGFLLANRPLDANFTGKIKDARGNKAWFKNGKHHRTDGPAVEWANGDKEWLKDGVLHREDGPAIIWAGGSTEWWYEGKEGLVNFPEEVKKKLARKFILD